MQVYLGTISAFGFNFAPYQWALCQGQVLPIQQNTALFSLLGTTFGGNGTSTFGLPNLIGRMAVCFGQGAGLSPYVMGQTGGSNTTTLALNNMPAHVHVMTLALNAAGARGDQSAPANNFPAGPSTGDTPYAQRAAPTIFMGNPTVAISPNGGGQPISIERPMLVTTYAIATQGIFPQRQ